jgi:hypothetical protein
VQADAEPQLPALALSPLAHESSASKETGTASETALHTGSNDAVQNGAAPSVSACERQTPSSSGPRLHTGNEITSIVSLVVISSWLGMSTKPAGLTVGPSIAIGREWTIDFC